MGAVIEFKPRDIDLIKRTVAKDCNDDEFRMFIHLCRATGLDPLRKQAYAFVFGKNAKDSEGNADPSKRTLTLVTAIAGYRTIADRTGNYRPDEDEPKYYLTPETLARNEALAIARRKEDPEERRRLAEEAEFLYPVDPFNPLGIERCVVKVWKYSHGGWHKSSGEAWWSEFVPLKDEWLKPDGGGRAYKTGRVMIDPSKTGWTKMPRLMIAKVAEALALRKAWPDEFSDTNIPEETHRDEARLDVIDALAVVEEERRAARLGRNGKIIMLDVGGDELDSIKTKIEPVPLGQVADRCLAFLEKYRADAPAIVAWQERNRHPLREFFTLDKSAALAILERCQEAESQLQLRLEADRAQGASA